MQVESPVQPQPINQPPIDLGGLASSIGQAFQTVLDGWAGGLPLAAGGNAATQGQSLLDAMWKSQYNVLTRIPPELTTRQSDVMALSEQFRGMQIGLMALLIVVGGYRLMFGHESVTETALQFGVSIVASASLVWWSTQAFDLANALSDSIGWPESFTFPVNKLLSDFALLLLFLLLLFFAVKAWFKGAATILLLDVLLVTGPVALLLWMIPQTSKWGAWWVDQFAAAVVSRPATAIVFRIGLGLVFTVGDPYLALVLGGAAFWLATELPDRLASNLSVTGGIASVARMAMWQRAASIAGGAAGGVATGVGRAFAS
jgi:hypothetical protein